MILPFLVQIASMRQEPHDSLNRTFSSLPSTERSLSKEIRQALQDAGFSIFWLRRLSTKAGWFCRIKLTAPVGCERLKEAGRMLAARSAPGKRYSQHLVMLEQTSRLGRQKEATEEERQALYTGGCWVKQDSDGQYEEKRCLFEKAQAAGFTAYDAQGRLRVKLPALGAFLKENKVGHGLAKNLSLAEYRTALALLEPRMRRARLLTAA